MSQTEDRDSEQSAVTALGREVERLGRQIHAMRDLNKRMDALAGIVARLAETAPSKKAATAVAPCWLDYAPQTAGEPDSSEDAEEILATLVRWVGGVYLRYSDARGLPECWLWHPDVVEELLWLHNAWLAAYDPDASTSAVGDWHDRQRPGVVRRIKQYAGTCALEAHLPGAERHTGAHEAPTADAVPVIAAWWALARDRPAPAPSDEQLDAARRPTARKGRR